VATSYGGSPVENIPLQAERFSGRQQKLFAFPPESRSLSEPECCSESLRNGVQLQTGIAFIFDRIPQALAIKTERALMAIKTTQGQPANGL
jgi:hypothetical protein